MHGLIYVMDLEFKKKKMIQSDYEREHLLDTMYQLEKQKQIEQEWWEWENRKPAIINVVIEKKKHESDIEQITTTL